MTSAIFILNFLVFGTFYVCFALCINVNDDVNWHTKDRPFRMQKINQLWSKAQKRLSNYRLADLYADLKQLDKQMGELKKLKADGLDEDGLKSAKMEEKFMNVLERFELTETFGPVIESNVINNQIPQKHKKERVFTDPKLQGLWRLAMKTGFSESELSTLKEEFLHHQLKVDEYSILKEEWDTYAELSKNSVEYNNNKVLEKSKLLKHKHKELKSSLNNLEGLIDRPEDAESGFRDHRVLDLWASAKLSNMTDEELDSLREELEHFEHRLKKHSYFEEQVRLSEQSLNNHPDGDDDVRVQHDKHEQLSQQADEYKRKVRKLHKDLRTKIKEKTLVHMEL